ncbi:MAG TPA: DUF1622 domain-containing protein [Prolixibacteraceae bacterium]|nr:DUF1622 domain-containing protein [Prolixibacteraceae bacterium]
MENLGHYIELIAKTIEAAGVLIIAGGSLHFIFRYVVLMAMQKNVMFAGLRYQLGKAILLGLEVLVAADIIATVSTEPTTNSIVNTGYSCSDTYVPELLVAG